MRALRQAFRYIYFRIIRIPKFNLFLSRIPDKYQNLSKFYYYGIFNSEERELSKKIESFRSKIPSLFAEKKRIGSFQSPHSGTFEKDEKGHSKSGKFIDNDIRAHLNTGTDRRKGILLRRIVNGLDIKRVLEFGTNTGFSGAYFTSVNQTNLVSVEGSQDLCNIAKMNIERISDRAIIMNCLFDDAIDQLNDANEKFDCVFIDGQHEGDATIHYAYRVLPIMKDKSIYIFDDIYWSEDMNSAWNKLKASGMFSETFDVFSVGIAILDKEKCENPKHYTLLDVLPQPRFSRKGW